MLLGFNAAGSHQIVDMRECHILHPRCSPWSRRCARCLATMLAAKRHGRSPADPGRPGRRRRCSRECEAEGLEAVEALTAFCERIAWRGSAIDEGYGPETRFEPRAGDVTLGGVPVALPVGRLPPGDRRRRSGAGRLRSARRSAGRARIADLFAGLGTFALALDGQVIAAEASRDAVLALKTAASRAGRLIEVEHRDLYRRPL